MAQNCDDAGMMSKTVQTEHFQVHGPHCRRYCQCHLKCHMPANMSCSLTVAFERTASRVPYLSMK
eukprot:scaffold206212_cov13-Tisochrysis_lutea.AAC.1